MNKLNHHITDLLAMKFTMAFGPRWYQPELEDQSHIHLRTNDNDVRFDFKVHQDSVSRLESMKELNKGLKQRLGAK